MQQHEISLETECYYHIYNRGINGESLFREERNYHFFLGKYATYIEPVAETYAYCLLKNHFHLLIRIRSQETLRKFMINHQLSINQGLHNVNKIVSRQFARFFSCYTQSINKVYGRHGSLFEKPFRRKKISHDDYFTHLIYYIHANPQQHGFTNDFTLYPHSSYAAILDTRKSRLQRSSVLEWFGGGKMYQEFHQLNQVLTDASQWVIE